MEKLGVKLWPSLLGVRKGLRTWLHSVTKKKESLTAVKTNKISNLNFPFSSFVIVINHLVKHQYRRQNCANLLCKKKSQKEKNEVYCQTGTGIRKVFTYKNDCIQTLKFKDYAVL